jgi:hypothetical protein
MANDSRASKIKRETRPTPDDFLMREAKNIEKLFRKAVARALRVHRALKNPVAVMQKGRVVLIKP